MQDRVPFDLRSFRNTSGEKGRKNSLGRQMNTCNIKEV